MSARDDILPKPMTRFQFPVSLAFAMTINESQGQTFRKVGLYLENACFSHGQLYVPFSRVGSLDNIYVCVNNTSKQGTFKFRSGRTFTRNIVYESLVDNNAGTVPLQYIADFDDESPPASPQESQAEYSSQNVFGHHNIPTKQIGDLPYVDVFDFDNDGNIDILPPMYSTQQLQERVAVGDRPGTSGIQLRKKPTSSRPIYNSTSEEDDDDDGNNDGNDDDNGDKNCNVVIQSTPQQPLKQLYIKLPRFTLQSQGKQQQHETGKQLYINLQRMNLQSQHRQQQQQQRQQVEEEQVQQQETQEQHIKEEHKNEKQLYIKLYAFDGKK